MTEYTAKITKKGQITIPAAIRHQKHWTDGSRLVFKVDANNNVEIHKEVNLYDTDWGNYDFKKAVSKDPDLKLPTYTKGREGWANEEK